jgi:hypothetical protein
VGALLETRISPVTVPKALELRVLSKLVFPQPEGPTIARIWPGRALPDIPFKILLPPLVSVNDFHCNVKGTEGFGR